MSSTRLPAATTDGWLRTRCRAVGTTARSVPRSSQLDLVHAGQDPPVEVDGVETGGAREGQHLRGPCSRLAVQNQRPGSVKGGEGGAVKKPTPRDESRTRDGDQIELVLLAHVHQVEVVVATLALG